MKTVTEYFRTPSFNDSLVQDDDGEAFVFRQHSDDDLSETNDHE